jgi:hypothetical protein
MFFSENKGLSVHKPLNCHINVNTITTGWFARFVAGRRGVLSSDSRSARDGFLIRIGGAQKSRFFPAAVHCHGSAADIT